MKPAKFDAAVWPVTGIGEVGIPRRGGNLLEGHMSDAAAYTLPETNSKSTWK